jgi:hypothetical protein
MGVAGTLSDNCAVIYIAHFLPSIALFAQLILPFLQRVLQKGMDQSIRFSRWRLFFKIFKLKRENKNYALIVTILKLTLNLIQS